MPSASPRLYAYLARASTRALILRRGPTKQVLAIGWDTATDRFEIGQWLKGRIYERRCDLSPSGERFLYFAASWKGPLQTWTAVSRAPWLTALALWPKGDAWGGGGLFDGENRILLNHPPHQRVLRAPRGAKEAALPPRVRIEALGEHAGRGEDTPIWERRLLRDGWREVTPGRLRQTSGGRMTWTCDPPLTFARRSPRAPAIELELRVHGVHEENGRWYVTDHALVDRSGPRERVHVIPESDWADFDRRGDLVYSVGPKLFRARADALFEPPIELADFGALRFEPRAAPPEARRW